MYIADIRCKTKEEFYTFARKMQELEILWVFGGKFTANDKIWSYYHNRTVYTLSVSRTGRLELFHGNEVKTMCIFTNEQIKDIHSLRHFKQFINSLSGY